MTYHDSKYIEPSLKHNNVGIIIKVFKTEIHLGVLHKREGSSVNSQIHYTLFSN